MRAGMVELAAELRGLLELDLHVYYVSWIGKRGCVMVKVKTFTTPLKIFETVKELNALDSQVNAFVKENKITRLVSVSDTCTADAHGATIGIVRVVAYEEA